MSAGAPSAAGEMVEGVHVAPDPVEPGAYLYMAGAPLPETDPQGRPSTHLWLSGATGILQLGARWAVPESKLERIRSVLAERDPRAAGVPALLRLIPAPVTIVEVALLAGEERAEPSTIASTRSSGAPPYSAIFSAPLNAQQAPAAAAALNGNKGRLFVVYRGTMPRDLPAEMSLSGDVREEASALAAGMTGAGGATAATGATGTTGATGSRDENMKAAIQAIAKARTAGRLVYRESIAPGVTAAAREALLAELDSAAASLLLTLATAAPVDRDLTAARFSASVRRDTHVDVPLERKADVADWFAGRAATDHIHPLG